MTAATFKQLDLAFAMDCTGSMGSYIQQARQNIITISETIIAKEQADIRLAMIEYRDHKPQGFEEFVTRVLDFTGSVREMKQRLDICKAAGGGDQPEAVADALHDLLKLNWRPDAAKICVFISDAPPHGLGCNGDGFPEGCPCGLDPMVTARELATKGISVYMVGCEPAINQFRDWFMSISHITGGQYVPLCNANLLPQVIIGGAQEEISLQQLMAEVNADVCAELAAAPDGSVDQAHVEREVYKKLQAKGRNTKQLANTRGDLPKVTDNARKYSEMSNMQAVNEALKKGGPAPGSSGGAASAKMYMTRGAVASARSGPPPEAMTRGSARREEEREMMDTDEPAGAEGAGVEGDYVVEEGEVSYGQAARMVQKSIFSNKLNAKMKK